MCQVTGRVCPAGREREMERNAGLVDWSSPTLALSRARMGAARAFVNGNGVRGRGKPRYAVRYR